MFVLREHDGDLYVVALYTLQDNPAVARLWFPTGVRSSVARSELGDVRLDGLPLKLADSRGGYEVSSPHLGRIVVRLTSGRETTTSHRDEVSVLPPKTRRRERVYWKDGEWWISGPGGAEVLAGEHSIISEEVQIAPPGEPF